MANNIYVGGFPYKTSKEELAKLFSAYGTVLSAKVILDRETGRPKGFGFIEMSTDAEAKVAVEKLNGSFIGDRKIFVVEGRVDKTRPQGRFAGGESRTPKPSFAPKPAGDSPKTSDSPKANRPGFVERRSGKDRRAQAAGAPPDRREAPAPSASTAPAPKVWEKKPFDAAKKPWVKKPFDAEKKPWVKKPFDAEKKPWVKKPFDAEKKPWDKKPFDGEKKAWVKKPFDPEKKPWVKKPFDGEKKAWVKKPFDRKPPVRGPKWTPKKD